MTAKFLRNSWSNGWRLFWLIAAPMSAVMVVATLGTDIAEGSGVSEMIGFSVRWAVPFVFLITGISAAHKLFRTELTAWLLRNRKFIGLCFAVAMAWQGLFIAMMSLRFNSYYYDQVYYLRDEIEGSVGYIFLAAMVFTSFRLGRSLLSASQWRLLHLSGLYFLWAYPFSVYWWNLSFYPDPAAIDYLFYALGFTAFVLRIVAWGKARYVNFAGDTPAANKVVGSLLIAAGLLAAITGRGWQNAVSTFLTQPEWSATLELWLPYWPFEPFLPLLTIGLGAAILTQRADGQVIAGNRRQAQAN